MPHNSLLRICLTIYGKLSVAGAEKLQINARYVEPPKKKDYIPNKKGRTKKGLRKYKRACKRFKKKLKQRKKKDKMILSALREMANMKKHFLATEIGNMKSGVATYKYLKTKTPVVCSKICSKMGLL